MFSPVPLIFSREFNFTISVIVSFSSDFTSSFPAGDIGGKSSLSSFK